MQSSVDLYFLSLTHADLFFSTLPLVAIFLKVFNPCLFYLVKNTISTTLSFAAAFYNDVMSLNEDSRDY